MKTMLLAFTMLVSAASFAAPTSPESCQLKVNGQTLWEGIASDENGQGFFSAASQYSQQNHSCVYAKIDRVPGSGRVYSNGQLVGVRDERGQVKKKGLTNAEADVAKRAAGGGCMTMSCIPLVYEKAPQYEQPVQAPTGAVVTTGSSD